MQVGQGFGAAFGAPSLRPDGNVVGVESFDVHFVQDDPVVKLDLAQMVREKGVEAAFWAARSVKRLAVV